MTDTTSVATPSKARRWLRGVVYLGGALVLVCAAAIIATPYVVRQQAIAWLERNGADQAQIADVHFNPFAGTFGIDDLVIRRQSETPLQVRELRVDFSWTALLDRRLVVDTMWLYGAHITVAQQADKQWRVGGIAPPSAEPSAAKPTDEPIASDSNWAFGANTVIIADSSVDLRTDQLKNKVRLDTLYVLDVHSWDAGRAARVGALLHLNDRMLWLGSDVHAFADHPDAASEFELDQFDLATVRDIAAAAGVKDLAGTLSAKFTLETALENAGASRAELKGEVVLRDLAAKVDDAQLAQGELRFTGRVGARMTPETKLPVVNVDGTLGSRKHAAAAAGFASQHDALSWTGRVELGPDNSKEQALKVALRGAIQGASLAVDDLGGGTRLLQARRLEVSDIALDYPERANVGQVAIEDGVSLEALPNASAAPPARIAFARVQVGSVNFGFATQQANVQSVIVSNVQARDEAKKLTRAVMDEVKVGDIEVIPNDHAKVAEILLRKLRALTPDGGSKAGTEPVVAIRLVGVKNISYAFPTPRLEIDRIALTDVVGDVARDKSGAIRGVSALTVTSDSSAAPPVAAESAKATPETASTPLAWRLGELVIDGKSRVKWHDQSVKPEAKLALSGLALRIGTVDSAAPTHRTEIDLSASLHPHNEIRVHGDAAPLSEPPSANLKGAIKQLDLTPFASYAAAAGYTLRSGRLDADIDAKVDAGQLDVLNKLVLTKLRLEGSGSQRDAASGATAMPLNIALGYLRDSDDRIKIDIPIKGDVKDPQFHIGDVVRLATQAAAQQAALSYVATALQPLGTVLLVGKLAKSAANALQLQPVAFAPGESTLDSSGGDYAKKIADILNARPGVQLMVCGSATEGDRKVLQERHAAELAAAPKSAPGDASKDASKVGPGDAKEVAVAPVIADDPLLDLASARSQTFRDALVEGHKVKPEQLFDCRPTINSEADAVPQVTLGM